MNPCSPDRLAPEVARLLAALPAIRPLRAGDRPLVEALVRGLSSSSRFRRFHAAFSEVPAALLARLAHVNAPGEAAFLATAVLHGCEVAVGEARYAISDERRDAREFAVVVADPSQRLGIGTGLIQELKRHAARSGVKVLYGDVQVDNVPMLELARRLGFATHRHPDDARLARMTFRFDGSQASAPADDAWRTTVSA